MNDKSRNPQSQHLIGDHYYRANSKLAPSQRETSLQSNTVSHWQGANLESALLIMLGKAARRGRILDRQGSGRNRVRLRLQHHDKRYNEPSGSYAQGGFINLEP